MLLICALIFLFDNWSWKSIVWHWSKTMHLLEKRGVSEESLFRETKDVPIALIEMARPLKRLLEAFGKSAFPRRARKPERLGTGEFADVWGVRRIGVVRAVEDDPFELCGSSWSVPCEQGDEKGSASSSRSSAESSVRSKLMSGYLAQRDMSSDALSSVESDIAMDGHACFSCFRGVTYRGWCSCRL